MTREVIVHVTTRGGPFAGASPEVVRRRADKMLRHLGLGPVELSVALVDDATIQELNRTYRRKDKPTDVLAFSQTEPPPHGPGAPSCAPGLLGDVIVSIETAGRQARRSRRPLLAELTILLAHGLLHLLGYDHRTDAEEHEMKQKTRELAAVAAARTPRGPSRRKICP